MTRILAILLVALLVFLFLKKALDDFRRTPLGQGLSAFLRVVLGPSSGPPAQARSARAAGSVRAVHRLQACPGCGVHVPEDELAPPRPGAPTRLCRRCRESHGAPAPATPRAR